MAEGNILENISLLESLNKTKANSMTISEALQESVKLQAALDQVRKKTLWHILNHLYFSFFTWAKTPKEWKEEEKRKRRKWQERERLASPPA